jgi:integrase
MAPSAPPPAHTLRDAIDVYLRDRHGDGEGAAGNREAKVRVERMFKRVSEALGSRFAVPLTELRREDARKVVAFMLDSEKLGGGKLSPSSVKREINQIKAVVSYALREFDLLREGAVNPFDKIEVVGARGNDALRPDAEKRDPLPPEIISAMRKRLKGDLLIIWRLLEWTGCRLAEITGLRVEDVTTEGDLPCIRVRWNEDRRLKNVVSIRTVPLVGDGLEAARDALRLPREGSMVFTRYGHHKGAGNASSALMGHVREETTNPRHVVHSLRHNLADRLTVAEVSELTANLIRGHSLGGVGNRVYGGDRAKLTVTTWAMKLAFGLAEGT